MRFLLYLLLILPLTVDVGGLPCPSIADASAAEQKEPEKKKDKRSEQRKRVEEETEKWVEQIQEDDRKRRESQN
jgi:hypothetical protein